MERNDLLNLRWLILTLSALIISISLFYEILPIQLAMGAYQTQSTINPNKGVKSHIQTIIDNATYFTIKNATTPSVAVDPKTGMLYAVYFRGENGGGNYFWSPSLRDIKDTRE
jgi:hypothetical protein